MTIIGYAHISPRPRRYNGLAPVETFAGKVCPAIDINKYGEVLVQVGTSIALFSSVDVVKHFVCSVHAGYIMPHDITHKQLSDILPVCMLQDNYSFNMSVIRKALKVGRVELSMISPAPPKPAYNEA